jgi:tRNA-(ms[2]io[6]A)-hydroxylase
MPTARLLAPILYFIQYEPPDAWVNEAIKKENLSVLLIDHLVYELKV